MIDALLALSFIFSFVTLYMVCRLPATFSTSEVTTLRRYINQFIIIIICVFFRHYQVVKYYQILCSFTGLIKS